MNDAVDPKERPEDLLDGITLAETETGDTYTLSVTDQGLRLTQLGGITVREPDAHTLNHWLRHGEFYVPEHSPASNVHDAVETLAGDRDD